MDSVEVGGMVAEIGQSEEVTMAKQAVCQRGMMAWWGGQPTPESDDDLIPAPWPSVPVVFGRNDDDDDLDEDDDDFDDDDDDFEDDLDDDLDEDDDDDFDDFDDEDEDD